jgi:hypothetical protein
VYWVIGGHVWERDLDFELGWDAHAYVGVGDVFVDFRKHWLLQPLPVLPLPLHSMLLLELQ